MNWPVIDDMDDELVNIGGQWLLNFTSNDVLGLASNRRINAAIKQAIDCYGMGSTGSRRLSGNHQVFLETEALIADWIGKPSAVLFNSGFQMITGLFKALAGPGTLILADKLLHASLIDGIQESGARWHRFRHNDIAHCEDILKKYAHQYDEIFLVCESVYSMDGDMPPVHDLVRLKHQFGAKLIIDEAHSIGVFGDGGRGWAFEKGVLDEVDILLITFGKAFGLCGAMVIANQQIAATLKSACRSYVYSTALPLPIAIGIQSSCEIIKRSDHLRKQLQDHIVKFKSLIQTPSNTHIQPIVIGHNKATSAVEKRLIDGGFYVRGVHHPTVPKGQSRLRITINVNHSIEQLSALSMAVSDALHDSLVPA